MPDHHGIGTFEKFFAAAPDIPMLLLSGTETESIARQALEHGAQDYILKNHLDLGYVEYEEVRYERRDS
jgi:DNA-binding NarL/FixJ family response regulator